jgi:hypothetical protein
MNISRQKIYLLIIVAIISSCSKICNTQPSKFNMNSENIVFGPSRFPCKYIKIYDSSVENLLIAIFSDEFETMLDNHIKNNVGIGAHAKAWVGLDAKSVAQRLRKQINGEHLDTYGGLNGWWKYRVYGNLAYDGSADGPIRINRIPLKFKSRGAASIANTIAHETAHRIGLKHPHSDTDLSIAYKEPPYIIGNIVENIVKGQIDNP